LNFPCLSKELVPFSRKSLDKQGKFKLVTEIGRVAEKNGVFYVECIRTIDGVEMTENRVICAISGETVLEAKGTWAFLTPGQTYSSQTVDIFNILFSVKKEINEQRKTKEIPAVEINRIDKCHMLYYLGGNGGLCFVPCWKIVTNVGGEFIFNATDGTLCTNGLVETAPDIGEITNKY